MFNGGLAQKDGRLKVGDEILEVVWLTTNDCCFQTFAKNKIIVHSFNQSVKKFCKLLNHFISK